MKNVLNNISAIILFNVAIVFALILVCPIRYESNDDIIMCLISSGGLYGGMPDAHLIFINYIYGLGLAFLYQLTSNIEWYTVLFVIFNIISLTILSTNIIRSNRDQITKHLFLLLLYTLEVYLIIHFQFTTTASFLAIAGLSLIYSSKKNVGTVIGLLLFLIASMIRFDAAMLVLLILLPFVVYQLYLKIKVIKLLIFTPLCIVCAFGLSMYNNHVYEQDEDWAYYLEWNKFRGEINDNPNAALLYDNMPASVSKDDFNLLSSFFADAEQINLQKIEDIHSRIQDVGFLTKILNIPSSLGEYAIYLIFMLALFVLMYICSKRRDEKIFIVIFLIFYFLVISYISLAGTLKARVFVSSILPCLAVYFSSRQRIGRWANFAYLFSSIKELRGGAQLSPEKKYAALKVIFLLLISIILLFGTVIFQIERNRFEREEFQKQYTLFKRNADKKVVLFQANFSCEFLHPLNIDMGQHAIATGWMTSTPFNKELWSSHKLLIESDYYLFMHLSSISILPVLTRALKANYNIDATAETVDRVEDYILVKFNKNDGRGE